MRTTVRGRRWRRGAAVAALILAVALGLGVAVHQIYVAPRIDRDLHRADAIVVLGGNPYKRFEYGIELAERGLAPQVVLSNSLGPGDERTKQLCNEPVPGVTVTCFLPEPWTTRGEAQELRELAELRGWRSIIVVTTTAHVERARFILERCYQQNLQMTDFPEDRSIAQTVFGWGYQTVGWAKALAQSGC